MDCSLRAKLDSQHPGWTGGPKQKRASNLPNKKALRLRFPCSVRIALKWVGEIEDDSCASVWNDPLDTAFRRLLQNPIELNELSDRGAWPYSPIVHRWILV